MIGLGTGISTAAEFNRRAAIALRGVTFAPDSRQLAFARAVIASVAAGRALDAKQQQQLYNLAHRYRRHINDHLVTEFAALRAKGHDA